MFTPEYLKTLVDNAREHYDTIIFDTPPLTLSSEVFVVGSAADGILMVVQPDMVTLPDIKLAQQILSHLRFPVLGLVLNGVKGAKNPNSYLTYGDTTIRGIGMGTPSVTSNGTSGSISADHPMFEYTLDGPSGRN